MPLGQPHSAILRIPSHQLGCGQFREKGAAATRGLRSADLSRSAVSKPQTRYCTICSDPEASADRFPSGTRIALRSPPSCQPAAQHSGTTGRLTPAKVEFSVWRRELQLVRDRAFIASRLLHWNSSMVMPDDIPLRGRGAIAPVSITLPSS